MRTMRSVAQCILGATDHTYLGGCYNPALGGCYNHATRGGYSATYPANLGDYHNPALGECSNHHYTAVPDCPALGDLRNPNHPSRAADRIIPKTARAPHTRSGLRSPMSGMPAGPCCPSLFTPTVQRKGVKSYTSLCRSHRLTASKSLQINALMRYLGPQQRGLQGLTSPPGLLTCSKSV